MGLAGGGRGGGGRGRTVAGRRRERRGRHGCESDLRRNRRESTTKTREGRVGAGRSIDLGLIPFVRIPMDQT